MNYEDILTEKGKELSFLLRHDKMSFEKHLIDENGWRYVDELIKNHNYTSELLDAIVETNNKKDMNIMMIKQKYAQDKDTQYQLT